MASRLQNNLLMFFIMGSNANDSKSLRRQSFLEVFWRCLRVCCAFVRSFVPGFTASVQPPALADVQGSSISISGLHKHKHNIYQNIHSVHIPPPHLGDSIPPSPSPFLPSSLRLIPLPLEALV